MSVLDWPRALSPSDGWDFPAGEKMRKVVISLWRLRVGRAALCESRLNGPEIVRWGARRRSDGRHPVRNFSAILIHRSISSV